MGTDMDEENRVCKMEKWLEELNKEVVFLFHHLGEATGSGQHHDKDVQTQNLASLRPSKEM